MNHSGEVVITMQTALMVGFTLVNFLGMIVGGLLLYLAKNLIGEVKELRENLNVLEKSLPMNFVLKSEYVQDIREIKDLLGKLFDQKQDKRPVAPAA